MSDKRKPLKKKKDDSKPSGGATSALPTPATAASAPAQRPKKG